MKPFPEIYFVPDSLNEEQKKIIKIKPGDGVTCKRFLFRNANGCCVNILGID